MSRESEPGLQHARSTNIRPLEWKLKYEELEKNYAQLEQKYNSLQQQMAERETEQTYSATSTYSRSGNASPTTSPYGSSSNPLGSHGRHDIVDAYKRTVAQLQEQKKVADERVSQLSQQLIQERTERNERGERLERSSNFERLERGSYFTMGGERLERQSNRDGLTKRPLQRARDNGLTATLVPSQTGRDLSPINSPRGERENGENESANVAQLRDRVSGLESKLRENEIRARNDILKLRQKAQTAIDAVKQTSERQANEIRALRRERDEAEARLEETESQLLATISELKMKNLEGHQTSAEVQKVIAGLETKLAERKERILELMVSVERERRKFARLEKEVEGRGPSTREKQEPLVGGDSKRDRGTSGRPSPRATTTNDRVERDRSVLDPPMMKAPSQASTRIDCIMSDVVELFACLTVRSQSRSRWAWWTSQGHWRQEARGEAGREGRAGREGARGRGGKVAATLATPGQCGPGEEGTAEAERGRRHV